MRQLTQLFDGGADLGSGLVHAGDQVVVLVRAEPGPGQPQCEGEADQALLSPVVQVPLQEPPLGVARGHDPGP